MRSAEFRACLVHVLPPTPNGKEEAMVLRRRRNADNFTIKIAIEFSWITTHVKYVCGGKVLETELPPP
jgi:hypothetical protein